jgi:hypothetical protein
MENPRQNIPDFRAPTLNLSAFWNYMQHQNLVERRQTIYDKNRFGHFLPPIGRDLPPGAMRYEETRRLCPFF